MSKLCVAALLLVVLAVATAYYGYPGYGLGYGGYYGGYGYGLAGYPAYGLGGYPAYAGLGGYGPAPPGCFWGPGGRLFRRR